MALGSELPRKERDDLLATPEPGRDLWNHVEPGGRGVDPSEARSRPTTARGGRPRESGDARGRLLLDRVPARRNLFPSKLVTISPVALAPDPLGHRYDDVKPLEPGKSGVLTRGPTKTDRSKGLEITEQHSLHKGKKSNGLHLDCGPIQ